MSGQVFTLKDGSIAIAVDRGDGHSTTVRIDVPSFTGCSARAAYDGMARVLRALEQEALREHEEATGR